MYRKEYSAARAEYFPKINVRPYFRRRIQTDKIPAQYLCSSSASSSRVSGLRSMACQAYAM